MGPKPLMRCRVTRRLPSECQHCNYDNGEGDWGKSVARLIDEWETDRRDLYVRALEVRERRRMRPLGRPKRQRAAEIVG